jgi:hypothetical protein
MAGNLGVEDEDSSAAFAEVNQLFKFESKEMKKGKQVFC